MNVVFIYLDIRTDIRIYSGQYHEGLASLSAVLKKAGHHVYLIHVTHPLTRDELSERLHQHNPDLIGFSTMTNYFHYMKEWAAWLKKDFSSTQILCGGVHPTLAPEESIAVDGLDMICIGEGEEPLLELCQRLEDGKEFIDIRNFWIKRNGQVYRNSIRPLLVDLDQLPNPDADIFDFKSLMSSKEKYAVFTASRGCPYQCTYCCNSAIRAVYPNPGDYVRFRSVERVIGHVNHTLDKYPFLKYIAFNDDILGLNIEWLREFAEKYTTKIGLPFLCNARIDLVKPDFIDLMKRSGCTTLYIGVESGNERIRSQVLNRRITNEQMIRAFDMCRKAGIQTRTYNMVGLPFEDLRKIDETIRLNARLAPIGVMVSIFYPYPGTHLEQACVENGFITSKRFDSYEEGTILVQPTISKQEVEFAYRYFKLFFRAHSITRKLPVRLEKYIGQLLTKTFCARGLPHAILVKLYLVVYSSARYLYLKLIIRFYNRLNYLFKG